MSKKNGWADLSKQGCDRIADQIGGLGTSVRSHLAPVLVQRLGAPRKLSARKEVRPDAEAKDGEQGLIERGRSDRSPYARLPGTAAAWLIEDVHGPAAPQEDRPGTVAARRGWFPGFGELPAAVPHN